MRKAIFLLAVSLVEILAYLDIPLSVQRVGKKISYAIPISIDASIYNFTVGLDNENHGQFIRDLTLQNKKKKHNKSNSSPSKGIIEASSLEGYSFEGWKRFFMEAFLWIEQRYYHSVEIDLSAIKHLPSESKVEEEKKISAGRITFGPKMAENAVYGMIKEKSEFMKEDVVSIYRGINDKNTRMQLGGFEENYARGHRNGILFYEVDLKVEDGKWKIPITSVYCTIHKSGRDQNFFIGKDEISLALSIQSPMLKLPKKYAQSLERTLQGPNTECSITEQSLTCKNMTSVDLALNYIEFKISEGAFINISLYNLRDSYNETDNTNTFNIQFTDDENELQIGEALFMEYYVAIDMGNKNILFSPLNRFPSETFGVFILRTMIGFGIFTVVTALVVMIWQFFGDPFRKNKIRVGDEGVSLETYDRPSELED